MKCRTYIKGRKIWVDDNNSQLTRPPFAEIILLRDGVTYKTVTLDSSSDGVFMFPCLIVWKNTNEKYVYKVDEVVIPDGYTKTIQGHNIINTLNNITISGTKIWDDNYNAEGLRPEEITVRLLQNGVEVSLIQVLRPLDTEDRVEFSFGEMPFADPFGAPYIYTITEDFVENYETVVNGFTITNSAGVVPFSFIKKSLRTEMSLEGASFEIRKNGVLQSTAVSDTDGIVSFKIHGTGNFSLQETQPPAGYMDNVTVYDVLVASDGTVTVDGVPADEFVIENEPLLQLDRATSVVGAYMTAPNAWPLHGTEAGSLFIRDKIIITAQIIPFIVKWDYGIKDTPYFSSGGGYDITGSYEQGIPVSTNGDYTVYAFLNNGSETVMSINIDRIRDGSVEMPYLLIDYATAEGLEPFVSGIGQFTLGFLQDGGVRLSQNYEIYENIDMSGRSWIPLGGPASESFSGSLNGNGKAISNLLISYSGVMYYAGMFHRVEGGIIENLSLIDCSVQNAARQAGGFVGLVALYGGKQTILRNLRFTGSITNTTSGTGAIAGLVNGTNGSALIDGCSADAVINIRLGAGILGGATTSGASCSTVISNCSAYGSITCENTAAGILGFSNVDGGGELKIENCINFMAVQGSSSVGGIASSITSINAKILSCCNRGEVSGGSTVGGIAGSCNSSRVTDPVIIENCYNTAKITGSGATSNNTGGVIGFCNRYVSVKNSFNTGDVCIAQSSSADYAGGIAGNYGVVENCAAINALCSSSQSIIARISQSQESASLSVLADNAAFDNMQVLINGVQKFPLDDGLDKTDGLGVTALEIKSQELYETSLGWNFADIWIFGNGAFMLPVLRGIPLNLQPTVLPEHLQ